MPKQSLLRLIKRWRRYEQRGDWKYLRPITRGVYVLYKQDGKKIFRVIYIGVAGIAEEPKSGIGGRLRQHDKEKSGWTHYSFFEVHDNISREEILEFESLLLAVFRHDPRIKLENKVTSSKRLRQLRMTPAWPDVKKA